ncbi:MAG: sigma-54-dependent Fis family transcriptional regulator [Planctomycetes bacterium]|nr:sigma-54-dependent Fis family transcriptional regulator [Planctomycetota bacterium]
MLIRIMLLIPGTDLRRRVRAVLPRQDTVVDLLRGEKHLWERAARRSFDVLIAHESTFADNPADNIALVRSLPETPSVILMVEEDRAEEQSRFLAAGVDRILYTGLRDEVLAAAIHAEIARRQRDYDPTAPEQPPLLSDFQSVVPSMQSLLHMADRVAQTGSAILIQGETGVGKEHLARAIHAVGHRRNGPFVAINCGGLPESLMESELFGHEAGAFTGANRGRRGCFELAHAGTVFLDEIGEMPRHLQVKLLRVLHDHQVRRLGSERSLRVDVRVIAATNRDLAQEVGEGNFRRDLYYRLSVVTLTLPPLRERRADLPHLVERALARVAPRLGVHAARISEAAMEALIRYDWPGNIRELHNILERALLLGENGYVDVDCLPPGLAAATPLPQLGDLADGAIPAAWLDRPLDQIRQEITDALERAYLHAWLGRTGGRIDRTAQAAGIETRTLYQKMKRFALRKENYKA